MTAQTPDSEPRPLPAPSDDSEIATRPAMVTVDAPAVSFRDTTGAPSRRRIGLVVAGALALVIVAAATSMAASQPQTGGANSSLNAALSGDPALDGPLAFDHGRFGRFGDITITAISGNDLTLGTPDGWRRTITVTDAMNLTKGGQDIAIGDLKVGDSIHFRQVRNDDGTYTVTDLAVVVPTIRGQASAVTSSGFKVTTRDGSVWTVAVNGSTKYSYGQGSGSLADVKDGTTVVVSGTTTGENAITALGVRVAPDRAVGTVTAKTADSITIKRRDGSSLTIHVDADTTFRVAGAESATLSNITVDMAIGVTGRARSDGSIDADAVVAGRLRGFGRGDRQRLDGRDLPGLFREGIDGPTVDRAANGPTA